MEFCFYCSRFPTPGQAWGCTPGNSRLGSWSPVGTVQDRPRRQPRRRLNAALVGEVSARPRGGVAPQAIRAWGPGPGGDRSGPTEAAAEPAAQRRACGRGRRASAPWVSGAPAAWNFAFPSLKLHKTGVNCRKSMVPGWKTLAKQAILRYYGKVNGAGGLPRRPPG